MEDAISRIRRMVIEKQDISLTKVLEKLGEDRPTDLVVEDVMRHAAQMLKMCRKMGRLKDT